MNINHLPENHHVISSMVNPFDANEELFFITHPRVNTYWDLDVWFCDMGTGDVRVVEPYGKVSDVRLLDYMERHVSNNSVSFLYPTVILPISMKARGFKDDITLEDYSHPQIKATTFIDALKEREAEEPEPSPGGTYEDLTYCDYLPMLNPRPHLTEDDRPLIPYEVFKKLMTYRGDGDFKLTVGGKGITLPLVSEGGSDKVKAALGDTELNPFPAIARPGAFMMGDSVQERANASKTLHHPSPEEISGAASKEYQARKAALKALLESEQSIQAVPKPTVYTEEFSDALTAALTSDLHFGIPASYKHHPAFQKPNPKKPKPNRNLDTIMGLLARTKK